MANDEHAICAPPKMQATKNMSLNNSMESSGDVSATSNPTDTGEVKQLKRKCKQIRQERDKLGEEYDQMKAQFESVEQQKNELVKANKRLEDQLHGMLKTQEESEKLRKTADELKKENDQLKLDTAMLRTARNSLHEENERLGTALDEALGERDGIKKQLDDALKMLYEMNEKYEAEVRNRLAAKEATDKHAKAQADEVAALKEEILRGKLHLRSRETHHHQPTAETTALWSEEDKGGRGKDECGGVAPSNVDETKMPALDKRASVSFLLTAFLILLVLVWISYRVSVSMMEDDGIFTLFGEIPSFIVKSDYSLGPR